MSSERTIANPRETILQFGGGRFLRAFVDLFVSEANAQGQNIGQIVVVQSTNSDRAQRLNASGGTFPVTIQGLENGQTIDETRTVNSISRALIAASQWDAVLAVATSPDLRYIVSNTTEAGYTLNDADTPDSAPPQSFPAKLLRLLKARFDAGLSPVTILPCELILNNALELQTQVLTLATQWAYTQEACRYIRELCEWRTTLVDRIVTERHVEVAGAAEPTIQTIAEPFAFWAIETFPRSAPIFSHPAIQLVPDTLPYFKRKVRILNGAHTALAAKAIPLGFTTVRDAMEDDALRAWLERLLFDEVVPTLTNVDVPQAFAQQVLERFANPFLEHLLTDIAKNHQAKLKIRLAPTRDEYVERFGRSPQLLDEVLAVDLASD